MLLATWAPRLQSSGIVGAAVAGKGILARWSSSTPRKESVALPADIGGLEEERTALRRPEFSLGGWLKGILSESRIVAAPGFNRWLMVPPAVATHVSIGSVYAWSVMNGPLTRELGGVASAADDWTLQSVIPIFSTAVACQGISAALAGKWQEKVGPRHAAVIGAGLFGSGLVLGGKEGAQRAGWRFGEREFGEAST